MKTRNVELMKSTAILAIGQIVPKIIAIIILPLLTKYLSMKEYGLYELSISVASFCIPLLTLQIQQGAFRYLINSDVKRERIITSSFRFLIVVFALVAIPIIIGWSLYCKDIVLAILFFAMYFFDMLLMWIGQITRGIGDNINYSISYIIYSVVFITTLFILLQITNGLTIKNVTIAMIISYLTAYLFLFIKKKIYTNINNKNFDKDTLKLLLKYSAPMVISSISLWIVNLSDRFFVSAYLGIEITAIYGVANRIPNFFISIYNIFNLAWTETTSKLTSQEKESGYYSKFFKEFYQAMVGLLAILICCTPILFKILINEKYTEAYPLMAWLYVGIFFSSMVSFLGSIYVGEKRTKDVGISSAVGAIINILINVLLMRKFGVLIAAISTIVSFGIIFIYRAIDIKKYVKINYNYKSIIIGLIFIILLAFLNYSNSLINIIISIAITIIYNIVFNVHIFISFWKFFKNKLKK